MTKGCHDSNSAPVRFWIGIGRLSRCCMSRCYVAAASGVGAARQRTARHGLYDAQLLVLGHTAGAARRTVLLPDAQRLGSGFAEVGESQPDNSG